MSLIPYYLQFVSEICEGKRPLPEGFALHETDDLKKAVELQTQIQTVGIPEASPSRRLTITPMTRKTGTPPSRSSPPSARRSRMNPPNRRSR